MFEYCKCDLCGGDDFCVLQKAEEPFKVVKCKRCGLIYVNPRPLKDNLVGSYSDTYYSEWMGSQRRERVIMWKRRLRAIEKYKKTGILLDIGCGMGAFLQVAHESGWNVCGTEISPQASSYISNTLGLNVFCGEVYEANFPDEYFDVISIWHTLEHMYTPTRTLREANRILKKGGLMVIAVPNINNFIFRFIYLFVRRKRMSLFSKDAREKHLYHFSTETLKQMLIKSNFKLIKTCPDRGVIGFWKRLVDYPALLIYLITKKNIGSAIEVHAQKE